MQVNWKTVAASQSPILFTRQAEWSGFQIAHRRIMPGNLLEHKLSVHEINVTLAGNVSLEKQTAGGKLHRARSATGNICLTPAGQLVAASWEDEYEFLGIGFDPAFVAQTALEINLAPNCELIGIEKSEDPIIQHIGLALITEATAPEPTGKLYSDALAQTLVLHLLKNYSTANCSKASFNGGLSGYRLRRATEFINAHLEQDLSLAEIAAAADLSQFHFARAFRRTTGLTPQQYLMQRRVERAKQLLAIGDLPIVEISLQTGFKNQSHFTTLFRKFTRVTPNAWRKLKHA